MPEGPRSGSQQLWLCLREAEGEAGPRRTGGHLSWSQPKLFAVESEETLAPRVSSVLNIRRILNPNANIALSIAGRKILRCLRSNLCRWLASTKWRISQNLDWTYRVSNSAVFGWQCFATVTLAYVSVIVIGHYQNEREAASESIPQRRLASFGRAGLERGHAKMLHRHNCCVCGRTNSHRNSDAAFLLALLLALSLQTIPSAFAISMPTQFPIRFSNGLLVMVVVAFGYNRLRSRGR